MKDGRRAVSAVLAAVIAVLAAVIALCAGCMSQKDHTVKYRQYLPITVVEGSVHLKVLGSIVHYQDHRIPRDVSAGSDPATQQKVDEYNTAVQPTTTIEKTVDVELNLVAGQHYDYVLKRGESLSVEVSRTGDTAVIECSGFRYVLDGKKPGMSLDFTN